MEDQMDYSSGANCTSNGSNLTDSCSGSEDEVDFVKAGTLVIILFLSLFGNVCTVAILSRFKSHKLPDVLVIGLACNDLVATCIPVPMSLYSYITLDQFEEGTIACNVYGTVAQSTRYASVIIVTLISLERYFAINRPFLYRKYATPLKCIVVLICCWFIAFVLALVPALDSNTHINSHDGFCLFDFTSNYAISVVVYAAVQFVIVFVCFVLVITTLIKVYHRRKQLQVQGTYNQRSQAREREHEVTFTKPNLTSRISDIGKSLKKAAPLITEKFQLGVEAQFARMLLAVVVLFYISWTGLMILILVAQFKQSEDGLSVYMFWGIRLSVISVAINPLLYGLLARQYRMAYAYVLRRIFSCCCFCCVEPPLKDIFASARNPGGELHGDTRQEAIKRRKKYERRYGTHGKQSQNGSMWSGGSSQPVLTRTTAHTHVSMDILPQLEEEEFLSTIQEDSVADYSTYMPSVGELSSSVVIPHQARENYHGTPKLNPKQLTSSAHNLTDSGMYGNVPGDPAAGSHNPLAIIVDIHGEAAVTELPRKKQFPPLEAIDAAVCDVGQVYHNPVYEMEKAKKQRGREGNRASHRLEKKPLEVSRSSPLPAVKASKRQKQKLQASFTLPPALDASQTEANVSLEDVDQLMREVVSDARDLAPPVTSGWRHSGPTTRASARTYHEMKRYLNRRPPSRPITSSHSFENAPQLDTRSLALPEEHRSPQSIVPSPLDSPPHQLPSSPTLLPPPSPKDTQRSTRSHTLSPPGPHSSSAQAPPSPTRHTLPSSQVPPSPTRHTLPSTQVPPSPTRHTVPSTQVPPSPTRHTVPSTQVPPSPTRHTVPSTQVPPSPTRHTLSSTQTSSSPSRHSLSPTRGSPSPTWHTLPPVTLPAHPSPTHHQASTQALPSALKYPPPSTQAPPSPTRHSPSSTQPPPSSARRTINVGSKRSVQELRRTFESYSSTPPTSPSPTPSPTVPTTTSPSPSFQPNHLSNDTDSGRESMVELVITDIDSAEF